MKDKQSTLQATFETLQSNLMYLTNGVNQHTERLTNVLSMQQIFTESLDKLLETIVTKSDLSSISAQTGEPNRELVALGFGTLLDSNPIFY